VSILGRRWTHYLPPILVLAVVTGFLVMTYQLPPAARSMPSLVGWAGLALALIDLVSRTGGAFGEALMKALNPAGLKLGEEERAEAPAGLWPLVTGIGLVVLLVAAFLLVGVLIAAPLLIFTALMVANRRQPISSILIAAAATAVIWLLFSVLLRLHLYPGVLFGGAL
jgi:hypothetical protein